MSDDQEKQQGLSLLSGNLIMGFYQIIASLAFFNLILQCVVASNVTNCNHKNLPFPFGFSEGSRIRLNCSEDGDAKIGDFKVENLTVDSILVSIPVNCSRRIENLLPLSGANFKMSSRNGFLLENCRKPLTDCTVPSSWIENRFGWHRCNSRNNNTSCFSEVDKDSIFLNYERLRSSNCTVVVSSIAVENDTVQSSSALSLELQTVELVWWLAGKCNCHPHAKCLPVDLRNGRNGFRCSCKDGFAGDGFTDGDGCRKVSGCNASKYMSGKCGGTRIGILIGGVIAGAFIMSLLALIYYCIRKRSVSLKKRMSAKRFSEAAGSSSVPLLPFKELERATNGFCDDSRLGTGAYGTVYAGKLNNNELVAIKRLRHQDPDDVEQVMNEIKLLSSVSHPNLVRLLGYCLENNEQILVYEFMPHGTLAQHLQTEPRSHLPWTVRVTIATQTAQALAHLHSAVNPPIYHRDIKSSNILLDSSYNSKIADFGLSRFAMTDDSHISTAPQGTPGYLDPQYHQNYHLSDKSDVYSFGVVLVEIITAKKVVDFSRPHTEINLAALAIDRIGKGHMDEIIDPYLEPNQDAWTLSSIHRVAELAFRCLAFHKDMRPSMTEVAEELEQIRLSGWAPVEENNMCMTSSVASSCSSPRNGSERSFCSSTKKGGVGSRRLIVPQKAVIGLSAMEEIKDSSPVSVQDPWSSEDSSSPSTNTLLRK